MPQLHPIRKQKTKTRGFTFCVHLFIHSVWILAWTVVHIVKCTLNRNKNNGEKSEINFKNYAGKHDSF